MDFVAVPLRLRTIVVAALMLATVLIPVVNPAPSVANDEGFETSGNLFPFTVTRLSGPDRFATGVAVSQEMYPAGAVRVYVATGYDFPDALAAGGGLPGPILLTNTASLPTDVLAEIVRLAPAEVFVIGGTAVISPGVVTQLDAAGTWTVKRLSGANRFATGVAVSQLMYPSGAERVYLAMGYNFPDALAAGGGQPGPILLTNTSTIPENVLGEIMRLGPAEVFVVGGTAVINPDVIAQLSAVGPWTVTRISGSNRFATGVALSQEMYPTGADRVYLATGFNFPDALAAGGGLPGPILLTNPSTTPQEVLAEIVRLGVTEVFIIGGISAISPGVATQTEATVDATVDDPAQRAVLVTLYNATNGPGWVDDKGWLGAESYCAWYGVTCGAQHNVERLSLFSNSLTGPIPAELGSLTNLNYLHLGDNSLTGAIPSQLGTLTSLTDLNLYGNTLTGSIPPELGNLTNLTGLRLYNNSLTGSIPSELGSLAKLNRLFLHDNSLSGTIPSQLGNLANLTHLNLDGNSLSGPVPFGLVGGLTSLFHLSLHSQNGCLTNGGIGMAQTILMLQWLNGFDSDWNDGCP